MEGVKLGRRGWRVFFLVVDGEGEADVEYDFALCGFQITRGFRAADT